MENNETIIPNNNATKAKTKMIAVLLLAGLVFMFFVLGKLFSDSPKQKSQINSTDLISPIRPEEVENTALEKTQKMLIDAQSKTDKLEQSLKQQSDANNNLAGQYEQLKTAVDQLQKNQTRSVLQESQGIIQDGQLGINEGYSNQSSIREDIIPLTPKDIRKPTRASFKNPDNYVPTGTFAKAVMIGGADASASATSQSNPTPMLFKIIEDGTLPNRAHSHLKGCFVTAAVVGDISSERGMIRLENLSCTKSSNWILDTVVEGTVFGPEGKNGVRGTPVWREGALLQRAFVAGSLSGFSNAVQQQYTTNSISPLGVTQTVQGSDVFKAGAANGASKAMDKLAEYNIQRAEQYHPVLQISAGTVVDVVFMKGFYLDGQKHSDHEDQQELVITNSNSNAPFASVSNPVQSDTNSANTLPLTPEQVNRLEKRQKELGLRIEENPAS